MNHSRAITIEPNTLLHGDCRHALRGIASASVDFVLTDPPYVGRYTSRDGRSIRNDNWTWLNPAFRELHRVLKRDAFCVCFYGWAHADKFVNAFRAAGFFIGGHFSFPKRYVSGKRYVAYQHEAAYLLFKGRPGEPSYAISDVIEWHDYPKNELHPSQKPLSILQPLIKAFCEPGGVVLDPFAGSGSTLLAAKLLGRSYLGIELDATYHRLATRRLEEQPAPPPRCPEQGKPVPS
jgi:site-specific DNA-methyltransferase (adenine-specific)